jgi:hypothetical protein
MKPDFSNLDKLNIKSSATALYVFYGIEGRPTLKVKPAHETNTAYMNAFLKKGKKVLRSLKGSMNVDTLKEHRERDYSLYSKFIIVDWPVAPVDSNGEEVPFSAENCKAFLKAIRFDMFNELREFCSDLDNFVEDDDLDSEDLEELAKN